MKKFFVVIFCVIAVVLGSAAAGNANSASLIDWSSVFNADGTVRDLYGGIDAVYLQDNISAGVATDMSAFIDAKSTVYNGTVPAAHDLGNGYVYATLDAANNLVIFAGVERLKSHGDTYVEFEFNQDVVSPGSGSPWLMRGARTLNDLIVSMSFTAGILSLIEVSRWDGSGYVTIGSSAPSASDSCDGMTDLYAYCTGSPVQGLPLTNSDIWDVNFMPVWVPDPDSFVQISVNVGRVIGSNVDFTSIVMRTPEDINLGSFRAMGYWGARNRASSAR